MLLCHVAAMCSCSNQAYYVTVDLIADTYQEIFVHYLSPSHYVPFHYS